VNSKGRVGEIKGGLEDKVNSSKKSREYIKTRRKIREREAEGT